ncbi:glutathione S-transferase 1-like [Corticium candelabrum]|uniref:glutathione S-transferase 1-like n=1 Tax=Corticium candelabrum TaxID=121492 RepID=UPI002E26F3B6|nr:glutathione S-transferase 1-like [Corticium candelabrum]
MPSYKLTYFNGRGRAELARLLFAQAGAAFEDVRIKPADWPALKPTTPLGCLPLLEVDGAKLCESKAIAAFIALQFGLHGDSNMDKASVQMIVCVVRELQDKIYDALMSKDEAKKAELMKKLVEETIPKVSGQLEALLKQNGTGWFVGKKVTLADIAVFDVFDELTAVKPDAVSADKTPLLVAVVAKVKALPNVAKWLEDRPKTEF